ncbi:cytochrome c oxidase subunit 3 [Alsobacter sp. SYSU M60028]|uniref:Cytochrome c oxidase subunit 3 n=1 Tax=Alsobacter ponti TaxID=2962936 RepID=A0ABT1L7N6_9HYPH|nr:cytochrome c oxidase subunit 3 [Alsobacter ponti]MCP8937501.1 cytochrome c oxidase subunit 3 [Alsobacter ponti]
MSDAALPGETDEGAWPLFRGLQGHPMMWVLIVSEFAVFAAMLCAFAIARRLNPDVFAAGQAQLHAGLGALNTAVLATSGWCAARASLAAASGRSGVAHSWLFAAVVVGLCFLVVKGVEYAGLVGAGHGLEGDLFFTLYFLLTGFHALHVVLGIVILAVVAWAADREAIETGVAFWHAVDLIWIVMFPVVYLLG